MIRTAFLRSVLLASVLVLVAAKPAIAKQGAWEQTNGPTGGHVRSVVAVNDYVFAAMWNGDMYRFDGTRWQPLEALPGLQSMQIAGNAMYARTYDALLRSADNGQVWIPIRALTINSTVSQILEHSQGLFFIASDSLYRSTNAGETWGFVSTTGIGGSMLYRAGNTMLTSNGFSGLFRSEDQGITWVRSENGLPANPVIMQMAEHGTRTWASLMTSGVFFTTDGGKNWTRSVTGLPEFDGAVPTITDLKVIAGKLYGSLANETYMFDTIDEVWSKTEPLGSTGFFEHQGKLYSANSDGVNVSQDGGATWMSISAGFTFNQVNNFVVARNALVASAMNGISRSTDNGLNWTKTSAFYSESIATDGANIYAESLEGLYRSTDDGLTWELKNAGITSELYHMSTVSANSTAVFAGFYDIFSFHGNSHWNTGGIVRSTDGGESWQTVNSGLANDGFAFSPINKIYAYNDVVFALAVDGLYRSTNNGTSWKLVNTPIDKANDYTMQIVRDSTGLYLASLRNMLYSNDLGATWQPMASGLQTELENHLSLLRFGNRLLLKSYNISSDYQQKWYELLSGTWHATVSPMPDNVEVMTLFQQGEYVFAGTASNSVWRKQIGIASVSITDLTGELRQNFPNPFSDRTLIKYSIKNASEVIIRVIDVLGREVLVSNEGYRNAGEHQFLLEGSALESGTYIYQIRANGEVTERQMVVQR